MPAVKKDFRILLASRGGGPEVWDLMFEDLASIVLHKRLTYAARLQLKEELLGERITTVGFLEGLLDLKI